MQDYEKDIFNKLKNKILNIDPIKFCENNLTIDGSNFNFSDRGYKPFIDIYRYIGIKALEENSKPSVLVKGRQVGGTTMALALEMYFMGCGLFGIDGKPPIRIIHAFPSLEQAGRYTKGKMDPMIKDSIKIGMDNKNRPLSFMESLLDKNQVGDSLKFKRFINGNHIWIESTGIDADRIRGLTADILFFDECFPYNQYITTEDGKVPIGKLYNLYIQNKKLPRVLTFNEDTKKFEYKNIKKAWKREKRELVELTCENRKIKCTPNHKFLTLNGWKEVKDISQGEGIMTSNPNLCQISYNLNDDQLQVVLGSFLGDGHLQKIGQNKYRLSVIHGIKQKDYCSIKANLFQSKTKYLKDSGFSKKEAISFRTKTFYLNGDLPQTKTHCPQWVLDKLDERGLAIWFMDDGSRNNKNTFVFSTCGFDEDSQIRLVKKLGEFGINANYKLYGKYYYIFVKTKEYEKLSNLVEPYINENLSYKLYSNNNKEKYIWNNKYSEYGVSVVKSVLYKKEFDYVYDIEVEDNHNFIAASSRKSKGNGGLIAHNCQDTPLAAITNATKILKSSNYGTPTKGVQIYFGTPKRKGSDYYKMWMNSNQQYYHLGCESCKKYFPLYIPETDDWEEIWIEGKIVKCTHCNHKQNKLEATERGKWIESKPLSECMYVGFHINMLFDPKANKENILSEKPSNNPMTTERGYRNEVLGEFFQGDSSPITVEEIIDICGDRDRRFSKYIDKSENVLTFLGVDYGAKSDLEQQADPDKKGAGKSYSTAVVISVKNSGLMSIEFAMKFKKNDSTYKKEVIDEIMRNYSIDLAVGDIGFSYDFSTDLANLYGSKYLVSRAMPSIKNIFRAEFRENLFPNEIQFDRDFYIGEIFDKMRTGKIRFPISNKDYEKISWLIQHCASMEIKPRLSRVGEHSIHYVKSTIPNDGLMALINAYIAYKFYVTNKFTNKNIITNNNIGINDNKLPITLGYCPRY